MNARDEWLATRRKGIGSSDAAPVLGLSPWKTPLQLYLEKRGEVADSRLTVAMEWGTLVEPAIIEMYRRRTGKEVITGDAVQNLVSKQYPFMRANLDGLVPGARQIVEAKLAGSDEMWGEAGSDQVPIYYGTQAQHAMAVTGDEVVEFAVLFARFGLRELETYLVPRDEELIGMLVEREHEFWQRVINGNPPDPTTPDDVRLRWPADNGTEIEATEEMRDTVAELVIAKRQLKEDEEAVEQMKAAVQLFMGEASTLTFEGVPLATWKKARDSLKLDADLLQVGHPEIYSQYLRSTPGSRRFLTK